MPARRDILRGTPKSGSIASAGLGSDPLSVPNTEPPPGLSIDAQLSGGQSFNPGDTFTVSLTVTNNADRAAARFLAGYHITFHCSPSCCDPVSPPIDHDSIVDHTDENGTYNAGTWRWDSFPSETTVRPALTFRVPAGLEAGEYELEFGAVAPEWCETDLSPAVYSVVTISVGRAPGNGSDTTPATGRTIQTETLRNGQRIEVTVGDHRLYVVHHIPDHDPGRAAVTTTDYELVDLGTAFDALWTQTYKGKPDFRPEYRERLEVTRNKREISLVKKHIQEAADIGVDALEGYVMFQVTGNPYAATVPIIDALTDSITWTQEELTEPYEEAFTRMANTARSLDWMDQQLDGVVSSQSFTEKTEELVNLSSDFVSQLSDLEDLGRAWATYSKAAVAGDDIAQSTAALYKSALTKAATTTRGILVGFAVSYPASQTESWFKRNAKISAIQHAYFTTRIPLLERLIELESQAVEGRLAPGDIPSYHTCKYSLQAIRTIAYRYLSAQYQQMADESGGEIEVVGLDLPDIDAPLKALQNAEKRAKNHGEIADRAEESAKLALGNMGFGINDAERHFVDCLNLKYDTDDSEIRTGPSEDGDDQ